jgi:chromosome segregation ATPase
VKGVWKCFENIQKELKIFFAEQENSDIADGFEVMKKFENNSRKLAAVYERLSADLKNIERDDEFAKQEREELETNIHEQTFSIEDLRDVAIEKLDGINIEIDDLRRQLEAKEMDAAEIKLELHDHEDSIEQVRATFSRQLTRLAKKESAVNESRNEWDGEDTIYKKAREEHELEVTSHSEALIAHDRIICQVKEEILVADKLAKIIAQEVVVEKSKDPQDIDDELRMVQAEVLQLEAAADEATQGLAAAKASIDGLEEEISSIEVRLPILESEKKLSASKEDFSIAAKASKAMKELTARKDRCNEDLKGEASEKQEAASKAADEALEALNDKKAIAHIKEKESGSKRMIDLVKNIIKLEKLRESVCGIDEGEMDNIKSVGGFVLDSEMSALMMEGDELDQKYGGWNEIMLEYASKENDDEDDGTMAAEIELSSVKS